MRNILYSLISLAVALFFIVLGVLSMLLLFSPYVRNSLVQFILENSVMLFLFGFSFLVIGIAIVAHVIIGAQKKHYYIKSNNHSIYISEDVFQEYLDNYWKQLFPNQDVPNQVELKKDKIHITAELPFVPIPEQKKIITRIERDLSELFNRLIGYRKEYILSLSFQPEQKPIRR